MYTLRKTIIQYSQREVNKQFYDLFRVMLNFPEKVWSLQTTVTKAG